MLVVDEELGQILARGFSRSRITASAELSGGVSARAVVIDLQHENGETERVVARRLRRETPEETSRIVRSEVAVIRSCFGLGIPAPEVRYVDEAANAIVLSYLDGAPDFFPTDTRDMVRQMAVQLARIHRVKPDERLGLLRDRRQGIERFVRTVPAQLDESLGEPRLRAVFSKLWPWPERNPPVLLHGDYWPGNLLWKNGQLTAVLDWEEACVGDPLADLSIARLDTLWAFGEAAMDAFTESYREHSDIDWQYLPHYDLNAALRPMSNLARWATSYAAPPISRPDINETSMRTGHELFVARALASLS